MIDFLVTVQGVFMGRKTYLIAFVTALLNLLVAFNAISVEHLNQINVVLVALGGAALRAGINKV